jgi:excisionase family DNA binding protein
MELLTLADVCVLLKVGRSTVYRMVRDGALPAPRRIGNFRQVYFLRAEFEKACRKQLR